MPGRVLMLAHHFPPMGGSGANRALAFARYLPMWGWRPIVVTPEGAFALNRDDGLLDEVPRDLRVVRTRSLEGRPLQNMPPSAPPSPSLHPKYEGAGVTRSVMRTVTRRASLGMPHAQPQLGRPERPVRNAQGVMTAPDHVVRNRGMRSPQEPVQTTESLVRSALRSNLGHLRRFPDAHTGWLPHALQAALREADWDVIYSSSGPFTTHLVGLLLKARTKKPWVAELRDGWYRWNRAIFPDYPAWRDALERRLEAAVIRSADRVVLVTERMADAFRVQYPDCLAEHFSVVPNGFDPSQFGQVRPSRPHEGWVVVHAGALYYGRSLASLLEAAGRLVQRDPDFARDFRLQLLGTLDEAARAEVQRSGLLARIEVMGQTDHATAIETMRNADALLLVANTTPGAEATVPGKLFEYLAVGRPVLAIAPGASSTADVLRQTGGGWLAEPGSVDAIASALRRAYAERSGPVRAGQLARFDRRRLAGRLAGIFDEVTTRAPRRL